MNERRFSSDALANIGISFISPATQISPEFLPRMARSAEDVGLHSLWVNDRWVHDNLEPLTVLATAAAVTRNIKIGTSILLAALRQPVLLAKALASLDFLSGGRLIAGFGLGGRKDDFDAAGVPFEKRGQRVSESIGLIRKLWSGEPIAHSGRFWRIDGIAIGPRPAQAPAPPIWLGGTADGALKRAGELSDGYICATSALQRFGDLWEKIEAYALAKGRDPGRIEKAGLSFIAIDEDKRRAIAASESYLLRYYGKVYLDVESHMVVGPAEACAGRIRAIFEKGVRTLILGLIIPEVRQLEILGGKILPDV